MAKYKIIYDKKACIGAGECERISPELWKVLSDGRAELRGAVLNPQTKKYEIEIDEKELKKQNMVVGSCPVNAIQIIKIG